MKNNRRNRELRLTRAALSSGLLHVPSSLFLAVTALLFAPSFLADAQPQERVVQIGYLAGTGSAPPKAFVEALRDLGYVENKNIRFTYRASEGRSERNTQFAAELVRLKMDVIVVETSTA